MANNRMYLRCKGCGEEMMLGKTTGNGWHNVKSFEEKGRELEEFIDKHGHCCEGLSEETCGGVNPYDDFHFEPFELTYESQDDWGKRKSLQQIEKHYEAILRQECI